MEVKVYSCSECSRIIQTLDDDLASKHEHRCPRHPSAPMIYKGNIYYTILVGTPAGR